MSNLVSLITLALGDVYRWGGENLITSDTVKFDDEYFKYLDELKGKSIKNIIAQHHNTIIVTHQKVKVSKESNE